MDETLSLPVTYRGQDLEFPMQIVPSGYIYKFLVRIRDTEVIFETDDSGELRAIVEGNPAAPPPADLLGAVAGVLQGLMER